MEGNVGTYGLFASHMLGALFQWDGQNFRNSISFYLKQMTSQPKEDLDMNAPLLQWYGYGSGQASFQLQKAPDHSGRNQSYPK